MCSILPLLVVSATAAGAEVLDQESPVEPFPLGNSGFNASLDILIWQQRVNVGIAGALTRIELFANGAGTATIGINIGPPWQIDENDFETTMTASAGQVPGWISVDMSGSGLTFAVGERFVIFVQGNGDGLGLVGTTLPGGGSYLGGELWVNLPAPPHPISDGDADFGFRTFVDDSPPPPPTPGDLDGDGMVGIEDFLALLALWGPCPDPCPPSCLADLDDDCIVGITDFLILLANWG